MIAILKSFLKSEGFDQISDFYLTMKAPKKSIFKRMAGVIVAAEGVALIGSYILWRRLNRDQV